MNRLVFVNLFMLLAGFLLTGLHLALSQTLPQTSQPAPMNSVLDGEIESLPAVAESLVVVPPTQPTQPETHDAGDEIDELLTLSLIHI